MITTPPAIAINGRRNDPDNNLIDSNLKPVQTREFTLGLDKELNRIMSIGVRYVHKWLDRTIEDVGILVPGVGEVFFIANPGEGVAEQILPEPAPKFPKAQRDYDGVEFRLTKRFANRFWSRKALASPATKMRCALGGADARCVL